MSQSLRLLYKMVMMIRMLSIRMAIIGMIIQALSSAEATPLSATPSLSVHESAYGIRLDGKHRQSIQSLTIRIASHAPGGEKNSYEVQCFFLKRGKQGAPPGIDDTVIFEITNPKGNVVTCEVEAKPIPLPAGSKTKKPSKKSSDKGAKKSPKSATPPPDPTKESPRAGYIVRILGNGGILRQRCSEHSLEIFLHDHPDFLDQAAEKKSARHVDGQALIKR